MEKKNIKDSERVIAYLQMLQSIISRMANNSGGCKLLVATIIALISFSDDISWIIAMIIILYGFLTDSYYLALEKIYRDKYNKFLLDVNNDKVDELKIYELYPKNSDYEGELFFKILKSMTSFSVWSFYGTLLVLVFIIKGGI